MGDYMGKRTGTAKWVEKEQRWRIRVQKDGVRKSFYSSKPGRTGQREANAKADAWLDDNIINVSQRLDSLFDEYVEDLKLTTSYSHWRRIESMIRVWFKPEIGRKKISVVTEQDFQTIINKGYSKGLAKKTLTNMRATMINFIKYCRKKKMTTMVFEDLQIPKGARTTEKQILQPKDIEILFSVDTTFLNKKVRVDEYINAYRFQVLTGLRPGELIGLRWSDIKNGIVYIKRSINCWGEETLGKNENAIRHFALSEYALRVLEDQKKFETEDSVFEISNTQNYYFHWKRYCETNGLPKISLYEIRHTFVSIASVLPDGRIKSIVGHSKSMDTYGIYGHEVSGAMKDVADKLNNIFGEIIKK